MTDHERAVTLSLIEALPRFTNHLDEPADPLSLCADSIADIASGPAKIVLSGLGGDEMFGGFDRYYGTHQASANALSPSPLRQHVIAPFVRALPGGGWYRGVPLQLKWLDHVSAYSGGDR